MSREDDDYRAAQLAGDGWLDALDKGKEGGLKPTMKNAYLLLKHGLELELAFDEFALDVLKRAPPPWSDKAGPWTDYDDLAARLRIGALYGVDFRTDMICGAALLVAKDTPVHPVREYLDGLKWDGTSRLCEFLTRYLGAHTFGDDPEALRYLGAAGSMWLIAAIARIYEPGCKFDYVMIFEGNQGIGKSTVLQLLAGDWFLDTPFVIGDDNAHLMMRGKWIVELAELDSFNKAESTKAKAFFGLNTATVRPPYGRRTVEIPRQCVFAGTTNQDEYLRDGTGNRRYWPVLCLRIDLAAVARDRDQLWAEAVVHYRAGSPFHPGPQFDECFRAQQRLREISDPWEPIVQTWLDEPDIEMLAAANGIGITTDQVLRGPLKFTPDKLDDRASQMRVGKVLRKLKLRRFDSAGRAPGRARHVYRFPENEKNAQQVSRNSPF